METDTDRIPKCIDGCRHHINPWTCTDTDYTFKDCPYDDEWNDERDRLIEMEEEE